MTVFSAFPPQMPCYPPPTFQITSSSLQNSMLAEVIKFFSKRMFLNTFAHIYRTALRANLLLYSNREHFPTNKFMETKVLNRWCKVFITFADGWTDWLSFWLLQADYLIFEVQPGVYFLLQAMLENLTSAAMLFEKESKCKPPEVDHFKCSYRMDASDGNIHGPLFRGIRSRISFRVFYNRPRVCFENGGSFERSIRSCGLSATTRGELRCWKRWQISTNHSANDSKKTILAGFVLWINQKHSQTIALASKTWCKTQQLSAV